MIIFTYTNALAKNFREKRNIKAQTWHSFFRQNGVGEWISECMEEKKFPQVVIWDEVCTVPKGHAIYHMIFTMDTWSKVVIMSIYYISQSKLDKVITPYMDREHKCQIVCCGDDTQSLPFFGEMLHNWLKEIATQKCLELHRIKYPDPLVPLIYRPKDGHKQNCLIPIPGSSEKQELVKNDIVYLPLNTLPEKFIKDILIEEKILDWDLEYAMTVHTSPPLPPEIEEAKNMKAIEHSLRPFISEKLVGYMDQDKKKGLLGYHLEWELSGEVVSGDTDKSKEPGKWKPIWKVPSKEVATIFDSATKTGISETGARELDNMTFGGEGPPIWPPESYRKKRTYILELGTRGRKTIVAPNAG
ncbi:hypothetical protein C2G38_2219629 [Gigaspora rosea]|uniref:Uncharacterized protein n=1 Tax=Gigaspora rosea TaxID=44941 RepID=A0A397UDL2_9GLOM|nr:hypothetical protein C2G38_2219629 [Gigaspora rosea]